MKTREEVAEYINSGENIRHAGTLIEPRAFNNQFNSGIDSSKGGWHYGKVELRDLLDFIYEGKPTNDAQLITRLEA